MSGTVFTIGHSTHSVEDFIALLVQHGITALGDVRSTPYSRYNPQFNREALKPALKERGIQYVFLGAELGGRSADPACYEHGRLCYDRVVRTALFSSGLDRVEKGCRQYKLALMCAEKEPLNCHRTLLLAPELAARGLEVVHIHADGMLESHEHACTRLSAADPGPGLFAAAEAPIALDVSQLRYPLCTATDPSTPPSRVEPPAAHAPDNR